MKIISWNVNGIRACYKKGLLGFVQEQAPDIFCVQESKVHREQLEPDIVRLDGLESYWSSAIKKGYSGTATFSKTPSEDTLYGIDIVEYDSEGRFVITQHDDIWIYNVYFPNGGSGDIRHQFKQRFLKDFLKHLRAELKSGKKIIVLGDYNVAHQDMDVYDPVKLTKVSGFLPEERKWFNEFLEAGFIDTFRHLHPKAKDKYTWWDYRTMARYGNRGWRIDYISVSKNLEKRIKSAEILDQTEGSDHCPIVLTLK